MHKIEKKLLIFKHNLIISTTFKFKMAESAYTVFQRDSVDMSSFEDSRIEAERYYPGSFSDELFD